MAAHAYDLAVSVPCRKPVRAEAKQNKPQTNRLSRHRVHEVLNYLLRHDDADGQADDVVGAKLGLSPATVDRWQTRLLRRFHRENIRLRSGITNAIASANSVEHEMEEEEWA